MEARQLILKPCSDVHPFGSTLIATVKWPGRVQIDTDDWEGRREGFEVIRLGSRPNSTVDFVGAAPGMIGLAISQDGPIRAFPAKEENTLFCRPNCATSASF